jgi:hypothetical protein
VSVQAKAELEQHVAALRRKHAPIIEHRDRRIAHTDVKIVSGENSLDGISRAQIKEAIAEIVDTLNRVALAGGTGEHGFDVFDARANREVDVLCRLLSSGSWERVEQELTVQRLEKRLSGWRGSIETAPAMIAGLSGLTRGCQRNQTGG